MSGKRIGGIGCVALLAMAQILNVDAGLTVTKEHSRNKLYKRKQVCASEEDGSALIWNSNIVWKYDSYKFSDRTGNMNFYSSPEFDASKVDCPLDSDEDCTRAWEMYNWKLAHSTEKPMGPVYDTRWEDFVEFDNFDGSMKYRWMGEFPKTGSIPISIRGMSNAHILLCETVEYSSDFCYSVIIGGWDNTGSVIRRCPIGVPDGIPAINTECAKAKASYSHVPLKATEWKTFVLSWDKIERNLTIYDETKMILTYRDVGNEPKNPSNTFDLFIRSLNPLLYRIHKYSYLYTTDPEATLKSPEFFIQTQYICIQMLIGLCAECQMEIVLKNERGMMNEISMMTVNGSSASTVYGLPMWHNVKINETLDINSTLGATIALIPKLERASERPFWAFANFRMCPPVGTIRLGTMTATVDYYGNYFWPEVTCQKISYDKNEIVSALPEVQLGLEFDGMNCPKGMIGPDCKINCYDHYGTSSTYCKYVGVCSKRGCSCAPGYTGGICDTSCSAYHYGHDCKERCGQCLNTGCDYVTGVCAGGCRNTAKYYIPPLCNTAIGGLPEPKIDFVNVTSVSVSLEADDEYKQVPSSYTFAIKNDETGERKIADGTTIIYQNTTILTKTLDDLRPGTVYFIQCILYVDGFEIAGKWQSFTTACSASTEFHIEPSENGFTIKQRYEAVDLYPCPARWYDISVHEVDTGTELRIGRMTNFPFNFTGLDFYTLYKIVIGKEETIFYSQEVQTLEAAPTKVPAVQSSLIDGNSVYLTWSPPNRWNGVMQKYEVTLKVVEYAGCKQLKKPSPTSEDIIRSTTSAQMTLTDLHPFAKYSATVTACNSKCGPGAQTTFTTLMTDIPTAILSNLTQRDTTLIWDNPTDCTTITGPIPVTRVIITGFSDAVKGYNETRQTKSSSFSLLQVKQPMDGAELFKVQVFAIRGFNEPHNESAGAELIFASPPKAPPPVRDLQLVEFDAETSESMLRWREPSPPIHGEIEYYSIAFCNSQCQMSPTKVLPDWICPWWKDYICVRVPVPPRIFQTIVVYGHNKGVAEVGGISTIPDIRYETAPDAPANFTIDPLDGGVLDLKWSHPWRTGGHLNAFVIEVQLIKSELRRQARAVDQTMTYEYPITNYTSEYSERLYMHPSSSYNVSVYGRTNQGLPGSRSMISVETPVSIALNGDLLFSVNRDNSLIKLQLPNVVNDTTNSAMHIVVKGPNPCEQRTKLSKALAEQAGVDDLGQAWRAATISPGGFGDRQFEVGDNRIYGGATNCPLTPQSSYEVIVVLQADKRSISENVIVAKTSSILIGEVPRSPVAAWLVPIIIILIVAVVALYFYRRQSKKLFTHAPPYDEMPLSNNTENHGTKSPMPSTPKMMPSTPKMMPNTPKMMRESNPTTPIEKEPISRMSTPDITPVATVKDDVVERMPPIKVNDFEDYVRQAIASGLLDKQYETFPRGQTKPWDYGKLPQNKSKNRYANLIAYDETRVILEKLPNDPYSDYINANYIKGYKKEKRYIATQGPKQNTVIDFWRMIWNEEVLIICMLANVIEGGKTKCEQYWPDIGKKKKYGDVVVLNAKHNVFADYTFRTLHVTCGDITRKIEHLHYTAWPDHAVPLYTHSVVSYLKKLLATPCGNGPVVVHCSAGVGRTGTIILCDICLRRAAAERVVDVFTETEAIRSQRANMVDNKQQYLLAHLALVECLLSLPTALPCNDILPTKIKELKKQLQMQRQRLQDTAWQDEALRQPTMQTSLSAKNKAKNRYPELLSEKISRIYIKRYPVTDEDGDYVSGVYVDGVKMQNQYLAAQLPLPSTFNDFWRMVAELRVELIVMLQPPDPEDPTCCALAPKSGEFKPTPYINVIAKDTMESEHYETQKLTLIDNSEKPAREQSVTILSSSDWKSGRNAEPPPVLSLVTLWQAAERVSRGEGPVVTLCHDGVNGCGLYLALSFLLERMAVERECDVCLAIRAIRRSRPDFVQSLEHMDYLYDAALTYLEYFETYANFN